MSAPVVPVPGRITAGLGSVLIDAGTAVVSSDPALTDIAARFVADVASDTGLNLTAVAEHGTGITLALGSAELQDLPATAGIRADGADADERHGLSIDASGVIAWGPTPEAVFRAVTTLRQLIAVAISGGVAELNAISVTDTPRYSWRGLSLDVARTFHDPAAVCRVIDMLALYKLNVLHLHLTDDQGWRFEVPGWPALTGIGASGAMDERPGGHYTPQEVADLVTYAQDRFVTIVPEVDMPGHTAAILNAYPDLASEPSQAQRAAAKTGLGNATLDPHAAATWRLVEDAVAAATDQFSTSAWVHIGGDEAWGMPEADYAAFVNRAIGIVRARGRRVVGWQEIASADIGVGDLVQYWIDPVELAKTLEQPELPAGVSAEMENVYTTMLAKAQENIPTAIAKGATILVSPFTYLYLDRPYADSADEATDQDRSKRLGQPAYPPGSLQACAEWDPIEATPGATSDDELAGVEAAIWCESIPHSNDLEFMLLPRLATVGEKAWAARGATTWVDHRQSLARQPAIWKRRGWHWFPASTVNWAIK